MPLIIPLKINKNLSNKMKYFKILSYLFKVLDIDVHTNFTETAYIYILHGKN